MTFLKLLCVCDIIYPCTYYIFILYDFFVYYILLGLSLQPQVPHPIPLLPLPPRGCSPQPGIFNTVGNIMCLYGL